MNIFGGGNSNSNLFNTMDRLNELLNYVFLNFYWLVFSLLIITVFPATGALYYATNELAHGRNAGLGTYWEGFKKYFWVSYKWGILLVVSVVVILVNIQFYGSMDWEYAYLIRGIFIGTAILWSAVMMFNFPFLIEQEKPSLRMALRNGSVLLARAPLRTFGLLALIGVIAFISTYFFLILWVVISACLITYLSNRSAISLMNRFREPEKEEDESEQIETE